MYAVRLESAGSQIAGHTEGNCVEALRRLRTAEGTNRKRGWSVFGSGLMSRLAKPLIALSVVVGDKCVNGCSQRLFAKRPGAKSGAIGEFSALPRTGPCLLVDNQRPVLRQHGEEVAPPVAPLRIHLVRLCKRHQMADRPSHHVAVAV